MNKKALETEVIPKIILYPAILLILLLITYILIKNLYDLDLTKLFRLR